MNLHHDEVRKQRSTLAVCPSAKENVCVTDILYEIIEKETSNENYDWIEYQDVIDEILRKLVSLGKGIELNTGGFLCPFFIKSCIIRVKSMHNMGGTDNKIKWILR